MPTPQTRHDLPQPRWVDPIYGHSTRRLLEDAGVTKGMTVLNVEAHTGDVALIAAELVGPSGQVIALESTTQHLATARGRAASRGVTNISFIEGDFLSESLPADLDAIVGRFVLFQLPDPVSAIAHLASALRPGGIVALQETEFVLFRALAAEAFLPPLSRQLCEWAYLAWARAGHDPTLGSGLHEVFLAAGFPAPTMHLDVPMGGAMDWIGFDHITMWYTALLPALERYGIATAQEVEIETLSQRLLLEVLNTGRPAILPPVVRAWSRRL